MEAKEKNKDKEVKTKDLPTEGAVKKIRDEIRNWYGSLSVKELVSNRLLTEEIERLEKLLAQGMVAS